MPPAVKPRISPVGSSALSMAGPFGAGAIVDALPPREAIEMLIDKARQRARGGGDNLSLALVRVDTLAA